MAACLVAVVIAQLFCGFPGAMHNPVSTPVWPQPVCFGLQTVSFARNVLCNCCTIHQHVLDNRLVKADQLLTATEQLMQHNSPATEVARYFLLPANPACSTCSLH